MVERVLGQTVDLLGGNLNYNIVSENEAIIEIEVHINEGKFREMMRRRKLRTKTFLTIDRSGSMSSSNKIGLVREAALKFIDKYCEIEGSTANLIALLFDGQVDVVQSSSKDQFKSEFISKCQAQGGTDFSAPLSYIQRLVQSENLEEIQVIFMTDGEDGNTGGSKRVGDQLKQFLEEKKIVSKFNVIGVGSDAKILLGSMATIGSTPGIYGSIPEAVVSSSAAPAQINDFFEEASFESATQDGLNFTIPNVGSVYLAVQKIKEGVVTVGVKRHEIKAPQIQKILTKAPDQRVAENNKSLFDKVVKRQQTIAETAILKLYERLNKINPNQGLSSLKAELQQILQDGTRAERLEQNDLDRIELSNILRLVEKMLAEISEDFQRKAELERKPTADFGRFMVKINRKKNQTQTGIETQFRTSTDIDQGEKFLIYVFEKLGKIKLTIRTLNSANDVAKSIVEQFKQNNEHIFIIQTVVKRKDKTIDDRTVDYCKIIVQARKRAQVVYKDYIPDPSHINPFKLNRKGKKIASSLYYVLTTGNTKVFLNSGPEDKALFQEGKEQIAHTNPGNDLVYESEKVSIISNKGFRSLVDLVTVNSKSGRALFQVQTQMQMMSLKR